MYNADRHSQDFIEGVHYFLGVVEANKWDGFIELEYSFKFLHMAYGQHMKPSHLFASATPKK